MKLDFKSFGHSDGDASPECDGSDHHHRSVDFGEAEIHLTPTHDGHGRRAPTDPPPTFGS